MDYQLISIALASPAETETPAESVTSEVSTHTEVPSEAKTAEAAHSGGLSVQPTTVAFQALNFVILLVLLNMILYKPLTTMLKEREKKIREGVENADKAKVSLEEATSIRQDMMKRATAETQQLLDKARKSGEELRGSIVSDAQKEAGQIIQSGHQMVEMEKAKTLQELKGKSVKLIVSAAEKILREKIDPVKDAQLIEESLNRYSA